MSGPIAEIVERARAWLEQGHTAGWLDEADLARLAAVERATPGDLFVDQQARPLVVAFFGGTGVGKSSLLNRLAGEEIARTGVERPTSREVTVYVHEAVELADLPPELPLSAVRIKRHSAPAHRDVLWLDAPDIDSTAEANRRAALAWLPHVDLVCYVVSPERYRDDVGWRVLRQRGHKHGWIFVLNRWDEGDQQQVDDLARLLARAGFIDPLVLRTCCRAGQSLPSSDEFDQLQAVLTALLEAHGVRELTRLGHRARLQELRDVLQAAEQKLGDDKAWENLTAASRQRWQLAAALIQEGAEWSMRAVAARFATSPGGLLGQVRRGLLATRGNLGPECERQVISSPVVAAGSHRQHEFGGGPFDLVDQLWDDWAQSKVVGWLDATELAVRRTGLAAEPLRRRLDAAAETVPAQVAQTLRDHVRATIARPGSALARVARRGTGFLMAFLPIAALVRVAWAVVQGYEAAASHAKPYLGADFAIHSALLILLALALPFMLDRILRPSVERTVLRALRVGLRAGLDDAGRSFEQAMGQSATEARAGREQGRKLLTEVAALLTKPVDITAPALSRLVVQAHPAQV